MTEQRKPVDELTIEERQTIALEESAANSNTVRIMLVGVLVLVVLVGVLLLAAHQRARVGY